MGTVFNDKTGEPIEAAHIYYPSLLRTAVDSASQAGTTSDAQGSFVLRTELKKKTTLVISAVGYRTQRYSIEPNSIAGIEVAMKEQIDWLESVQVLPDEEPVKALINEVKNRRTLYDRFVTQASSEADQSLTLTPVTGNPSSVTPIYTRRSRVQLHGEQITPLAEPEVEAQILSETDYAYLLHSIGNMDFYQNSVALLSQAYISPLAGSSTLYYRYFLADSVVVDGAKRYLVHFKAKNAFDPAFNGEMEIDSATYMLRRISAKPNTRANTNYLTDIDLRQTLAADGSLESESVEALLALSTLRKKDSTFVFPTLRLHYQSETVSSERLAVREEESEISNHPSPISNAYPFLTWLARIATTGYIPMGSVVDIGHVQEILQVNEHETVHIGLPFRTNEKLMKRICLEAAVGYGVRDKAWKGLGRASFLLPTQRRNVLMAEYQDHYVWTEVSEMSKALRENSIGYKTMDFTAYAFEALHSNKGACNTAARQQQGQIRWSADWTDVLETETYFKIGRQGYGNPLVGYYSMPSFNYTTLGALFRLGWKERRMDRWFQRIHRPTKYPTLWLGLELSTWSDKYQISNIQYQICGSIFVQLHQNISLGLGGELDYAFQAGWIFGRAPFSLLHHFEGNQGYAFDPYRFTLMNNYQYAADRYVALHLMWNGRGILFNHIPGLRYLHLRELVEAKIAYGYLSAKQSNNQAINSAASNAGTIGSNLYAEVGVGIGNIFRIGELYSVWRLTPVTGNPSPVTPPFWAIRFRLHLSL